MGANNEDVSPRAQEILLNASFPVLGQTGSTPTYLDFALSLAYFMYTILFDTQNLLNFPLQRSRYAHIFAPKAVGCLYLAGRRLLVFKALLRHATTSYCGIISGKRCISTYSTRNYRFSTIFFEVSSRLARLAEICGNLNIGSTSVRTRIFTQHSVCPVEQ